MDERGDSKARRFVLDDLGHRAQRETVDEQPSAIAQAGQHLSRIRQRRRCGIRKALIELPDLHRPAMLAQPFSHVPVVQVTAGSEYRAVPG